MAFLFIPLFKTFFLDHFLNIFFYSMFYYRFPYLKWTFKVFSLGHYLRWFFLLKTRFDSSSGKFAAYIFLCIHWDWNTFVWCRLTFTSLGHSSDPGSSTPSRQEVMRRTIDVLNSSGKTQNALQIFYQVFLFVICFSTAL